MAKSTLRSCPPISTSIFVRSVNGWHGGVSSLKAHHLVLSGRRLIKKTWRLARLVSHSGCYARIYGILVVMQITLLSLLWPHWRYTLSFHLLLLNQILRHLFRAILGILAGRDWITSEAVASWSKLLKRVFATVSLCLQEACWRTISRLLASILCGKRWWFNLYLLCGAIFLYVVDVDAADSIVEVAYIKGKIVVVYELHIVDLLVDVLVPRRCLRHLTSIWLGSAIRTHRSSAIVATSRGCWWIGAIRLNAIWIKVHNFEKEYYNSFFEFQILGFWGFGVLD